MLIVGVEIFNDGTFIIGVLILLLLIMFVIVDVISVSNPFEPITSDSVFLPLGQINDNIPVVLNPLIY